MDIEQNGKPASGDASSELVRATDVLPAAIPLLAQRNRPLFPGQAIPLVLDADPWAATIRLAHENYRDILGVVLTRSDSAADDLQLYNVGTACRIHRVQKNDDKLQVLLEGLQRFSIDEWVSRKPPLVANVRYQPEPLYTENAEVKAYAVAIMNAIKELLPLNPLYGEELKIFLEHFHPNEPSRLADFAASLTTATREELQEVLETPALLARLQKVLLLVHKELEVAKAQMRIRKQVEEELQSRQREVFLREQLKAIQKELGISKDDRTAELDRFKERIENLTLQADARNRIDEELQKLALLETGSPEYSVTRNYLDWLTLLPWGKHTEDSLDLQRARDILDADHDGLEDVKERILEFIGVGIMKGEVSGSILLLVGPPGVGKTSLGRSIANALNRKFYRFSLGGMRDEAEIKGHRRTYIGAMPGKFVQAIKDAGSANPIIMLDEIDKIGASFRGDPASALLEVRVDLSKVLFICTANQLDTIPGPLLDRMETIKLSGYLADEKLAIARNHLLPRQLQRTGLKKRGQVTMDKSALRRIIDGYAREAGVRRLDKHLGSVVRKATLRLLRDETAPIRVRAADIEDYLGKAPFVAERPRSATGVITGLAWTAMGGAILHIEATRIHTRNRGFKLTGQLGDVMRESAEIAYSYIMANGDQWGAREGFFDESFLHLHVPAGATPKDGPSAGITMASALLSLARGRKPLRTLAMTGELTLTGLVLPVGGIQEKVVAAKRASLKELILPEANRGDFEELPAHLQAGLRVHFVSEFSEAVPLLFR